MDKESIPINLVFEDELQKVAMLRILGLFGTKYSPGNFHHGHGYGQIKKKISNFNKASIRMPYFIMTDLDTTQCAPLKISEWLPEKRNHNLIFRIAVPEIESWLIADTSNFAQYLKCTYHLQGKADDIPDGKKYIFSIIRKSAPKWIQEEILPNPETTAKIGPGYNPLLCKFVAKEWNPYRAKSLSPSLDRAIKALELFDPIYH